MDALVFYGIGGFTLASALCVILVTNPIFSALFLALTMVGTAAVFFTLGAYFVAGVQLIVYAGAVMVMFVMVVMLIDLKQEKSAFSKGALTGFLKVFGSVLIGGLVIAASGTTYLAGKGALPAYEEGLKPTRELAELMFTKYLFGFELIGVLLLVVLVGAIALARAKGGTHAK